jgi:hypothetical protein
LLGLSDREESVYAAIPLSTESVGTWFNDPRPVASGVTADGLIRRIPEVRHESYMRSRRVKEYPMLIRMNEASMLDSPVSFRRTDAVIRPESRLQAVYLPEAASLSYDMASNCQRRFSPETEFVLKKVTQQDLASLLHEAMASFDYANDLDGLQAEPESRGVSLYGCFYSIEGVPNGAYRYDRTAHALLRLAPGDHRLRLQYGLSLDNINLFQVPICLHVAGDKDHLIPSLGYRGYRIQQMEAGMLVHRLLNAASALGMGGRPLLGFHAGNCDDLYGMLSTGRRSLLQLPIGPHRDRPRLEGGLHG